MDFDTYLMVPKTKLIRIFVNLFHLMIANIIFSHVFGILEQTDAVQVPSEKIISLILSLSRQNEEQRTLIANFYLYLSNMLIHMYSLVRSS